MMYPGVFIAYILYIAAVISAYYVARRGVKIGGED